jgi:membrane protease YdiL (CAAX protease family)
MPTSPASPLTASRPKTGPGRAFLQFILAALYFFLARLLARHGAHGLVTDDWTPLVEQAMFAFLLLFGYAGMGFSLDRELSPISRQGLPLRSGWFSEAGLGIAAGWAVAVLCVLSMLLLGGIAVHLSFNPTTFGWLFADAAYFALGTLAIEIAFRGYPFQCAIRAIGELPAALMLSVLYGILQAWLPGASRASMAVSIALGLLLSMAYLRTRALWLPWGLHFGWVASRALLFGLPVKQISSHSPIIQGDPLSSFTFSGGDYGLDGSWLAFVAILFAMPFVYRATRDLSFVHNAPVLEPGGIPVDLDAAAKRQHETATRPETPEAKPLVQILPAAYAAPKPLASDLDPNLGQSRDNAGTAPNPDSWQIPDQG